MIRHLLLFTLLALAGCKSRSGTDAGLGLAPTQAWLDGVLPADSDAPRDGGSLTVRVMIEPATLNYLDDASHDAWLYRMLGRTVFEPLIEMRPDGALAAGLATRWTDAADHLTTTLELREAQWSDGSAFTAADVVATLDAVMSPSKPTSGIRGELPTLAAWSAPDERHVVLRWSSASAFVLRALTRVPIFQKAQLAGEWSAMGRAPLGTGPYVVEAWDRGQRLRLKRRAGAPAYLDTIEFRFVKDHTAAGVMFEKGEFDLMTNITPALWRALEKPERSTDWARSGWNRVRAYDNSYSYVAWNEARPVFSEVRVRRGLAHLYDGKLISRVVDLDLETPTNCPYFRGSDSCSSTVQTIPFDPSAAKALFSDAGFEDADGDGVRERGPDRLEFTFLLPGNSVRLGRVVPMLQEQFKTAGVRLNVERVETTTLSARLARRDFEVVSRVWTEFDREQELFQMFHSSQIDGGSNFVAFSDAEVDATILAIRSEFDVEKRRALERKLHERLYELQPYLFMTNRQSLDAAKRRVHGLQPSVAWYDLRRVWVSD